MSQHSDDPELDKAAAAARTAWWHGEPDRPDSGVAPWHELDNRGKEEWRAAIRAARAVLDEAAHASGRSAEAERARLFAQINAMRGWCIHVDEVKGFHRALDAMEEAIRALGRT